MELMIQRPSDPERLNGCGLIVANPPYTLEGELASILPDLSRRLAAGGRGARHRLDWIEPADSGAGRPEPEPKRGVRPRRSTARIICLAQVPPITDTPRQFGRPIGPGGNC